MKCFYTLLFILFLCFGKVGAQKSIDAKDYIVLLNNKDTLGFDILFIDENEDNQIEIDENKKVISIKTEISNELWDLEAINKAFNMDTRDVGMLLFQDTGSMILLKENKVKYLFQKSLLKDYEIVHVSKQNYISFCNPQFKEVLVLKDRLGYLMNKSCAK